MLSDAIRRHPFYRYLEKIPGILSLAILFAPLLLASRFPKAVAVFMLLYITRWCLRLIKFNLYLLVALRKSRKFEKMPWMEMLEGKHAYKWRQIVHVPIIALSKETFEIVDQTLRALKNSDFPREQIIPVLACEARNPGNAKVAMQLEQKYKSYFPEFHVFFHPDSIPGEARAKGPNITYAARKISKIFHSRGLDPANALVTTLDADNSVHPLYFSILTYHYLSSKNRKQKSYQPLPLAFSNIWDVPLPNRLIAFVNSYWQFSKSSQPFFLRNTAAHAQSLEALEEMDFWSLESINEDSHQYWRAHFHFNGNYEVVPLFIPVYQDAVQNRTYISTLKSQYRQLRRWAYSASDIAFAAMLLFKKWNQIPKWPTITSIIQYLDTHVLWATGPILVFYAQSIPRVVSQGFNYTVFAHNLLTILNGYFLIAFVTGMLSCILALVHLQTRPRTFFQHIMNILQWFSFPFVMIFYGALPSLEAQIRLLFNKPLSFQVTEKCRNTEKISFARLLQKFIL